MTLKSDGFWGVGFFIVLLFFSLNSYACSSYYASKLKSPLWDQNYYAFWSEAISKNSDTLLNTVIGEVYTPKRENVRHLVFISAGQQGVMGKPEGMPNSLTGQPASWDEIFSPPTANLCMQSLVGQLISKKLFKPSDTFMAAALNSGFNHYLSPEDKNRTFAAYYSWLKSHVELNKLESIFFAGSSRGGTLVTRLAQKFNADFPNVDIHLQTYDTVPAADENELGTHFSALKTHRISRPGDDDYWAWESNIERLFSHPEKIKMIHFVGGDSVLGDFRSAIHPLSHIDANEYDYYNGWFRQVWSRETLHNKIDDEWPNGLDYFIRQPDQSHKKLVGDIKYKVHSESKSWGDWEGSGDIGGRTNEGKRMTGIAIEVEGPKKLMGVEYDVYFANTGWKSGFKNGDEAKYKGRKARGIKIRLVDAPEGTHVEYRVLIKDNRWDSWKRDGSLAGNDDGIRTIEAVQIRLVKDVFRVNGKKGNPVVFSLDDPLYLLARRADSEDLFLGVSKIDKWWNNLETATTEWLDDHERAQALRGTMSIRQFYKKYSGRDLQSGNYYRVKLADGYGWDSEDIIVYVFDSSETESNNSAATADPIQANGQKYFGVTDSNYALDWWSFNISSARTVNLSLSGISGDYVSIGLYKNGKLMSTVSSNSSKWIRLNQTGRYELKVQGYGGTYYYFTVK